MGPIGHTVVSSAAGGAVFLATGSPVAGAVTLGRALRFASSRRLIHQVNQPQIESAIQGDMVAADPELDRVRLS